ncbi:MAG: UDP-N-acetylmuramate dehydrogenase [Verrucomicrobia bacterium]|jgi:UDP-N-acetylenolpyruvoylglucosamine reductase|nr:UDP-N-acetylmuramate dehydrogenase [Verrucomicrobiota bacterium]
MTSQSEKFLFLGVGGMGMGPIAGWMAQAGYSICGYDAHLQERVRYWLDSAGVVLEDFIFPEQVGAFTTLVYSSAVAPEHPILVAARAAGLRLLRRGEMLADLARDRRLIAIVGSHGKTTTSGMIAHGIQREGIECSYILGGLFADGSTPPWQYAPNAWLVAEIDESDGTIEGFSPHTTVVLNVDWDHADHYASPQDLEAAFSGLMERTQEAVILPEDCRLRPPGGVVVSTFTGETARRALLPPPPGRFNELNGDAAAAVLGAFREQLPPDLLTSFPGMARRQAKLHASSHLTIIEDYAHHPTEIEALIECLRANEPEKRLVVVFQPHRFSRTRQFKAAFAYSLSAADAVYLLPVYAAHECGSMAAATRDLAAEFSGAKPTTLSLDLAGIEALARSVCSDSSKGGVQVAFVGAGDVEEFAAAFAAHCEARSLGPGTVAAGQIADRPLRMAWARYLESRVSPACLLKFDETLANKTTMRIGGAARFYAEPANLSDLRVLLRAAQLFDLPVFHIGRGSNLLVSDTGFDGLVIRFSARAWRRVESLGDGRIWAAAGGRLKEICGYAAKQGLSGFEFLEGIPGAVGGALRMNAGAMGSWIFDLVERVQMLDECGVYHDLPKEAFHFGYRKVEEISRGIALGAILRSVDSATECSIRGRIDSYSTARKESQPRGASAGCIFKNPEGNYAGKLIDELGIKGMRVGGAEVSAIHGNFIVNQGGATAGDVIELIRRVRAKVKAESGYNLEPEVLLVGQSWEDVLAE